MPHHVQCSTLHALLVLRCRLAGDSRSGRCSLPAVPATSAASTSTSACAAGALRHNATPPCGFAHVEHLRHRTEPYGLSHQRRWIHKANAVQTQGKGTALANKMQ